MTEPLDPWEADRQAGRDILAQRGNPHARHILRVEIHVPVSRGTRADETLIDSRELDTDTTAVLVARVGYDALTGPDPSGRGPTDRLLDLAAAHRHPDIIKAAVWADQLVGARLTLRLVAQHPQLPDTEPEPPPTPTEPMVP